MIAGPSEVLVVADGANDPAWIAADLLAQAEHDAAAQSILITDDAAFAERGRSAVEAQLRHPAARDIADASWQANGCIIVVEHLDEAPALIDRIAPEHLQLAVDDPDALLSARVRNAGSIFLGRLHAGGDGRLRGRSQPRAADGAQRAVLVRPRRPRLHEALDLPRLRRRRALHG